MYNNSEWPESIVFSYDNENNQYKWIKGFGESSVPGKVDKIIIKCNSGMATLILNENENIILKINKDGIVNMICFDVCFYKIDRTTDEYINRYTLLGKYIDNNNNIYEFSKNNKAIWPDQTFYYHFGFSYFSDKNTITVLYYDPSQTDIVLEAQSFIQKSSRRRVMHGLIRPLIANPINLFDALTAQPIIFISVYMVILGTIR